MIRVTDHALVRFLERSGAGDIQQLRQTIAASLERGRRAAERAGIADYSICVDGLTYVIEGGVLVTVLTGEMRRQPPRRRR